MLFWCGLVAPAAAQERADSTPVGYGTVASVAGSGLAYAAPRILHIHDGPPSCAPCDPGGVPAFDRWAIRPVHNDLSIVSTVTLAALAGATVWSRGLERAGVRRTAATIEAASWAIAAAELTKALTARNRPVLYTDDALGAVGHLESRRSFPSGHAAAAFAIGVSYWLDGRDRSLPLRIAALSSAAGVAMLRVAAAKHFPSDVVAGAALGTASALIVHEIRF